MTTGPHQWRKSTYSSSGGDCVELAGSLDLVRDSKNPTGPTLRADLAALLTAVRSNHFTR
jgi:hypothetical protein